MSFYIDGGSAAIRLVDVGTGKELRRVSVSDTADMMDICLDCGTFVVDGPGESIDGLYDSSKIRVEVVGDSDQVITNNSVGAVEGDLAVSENVVVSEYDGGKVEIQAAESVRLVGMKNGVATTIPATVVESDNASDNSETPSGPFSNEIVESEHGSVTLAPSKPHEGDAVVVEPKPDKGFVTSTVTVTCEDGKTVKVSKNEDGTWTFIQPGCDVTVTVTFDCGGGELCPTHDMGDVDQTQWYHDAVDWAVASGAILGYGDGTFGPEATLARSEMATVLWRMAGRPGADSTVLPADVPSGEWFTSAVTWSLAEGVFNGNSDGSFDPAGAVTREQAACVLYNRAEAAGEDVSVRADLSGFKDASELSGWARDAMSWAVAEGVFNGTGDGRLEPGRAISRSELAAVLYNMETRA